MRNCAFIGELLASAFGENHAPGAVRPFCSAYRIAIPEFGGASNEHSHAGIMDQGFGCLAMPGHLRNHGSEHARVSAGIGIFQYGHRNYSIAPHGKSCKPFQHRSAVGRRAFQTWRKYMTDGECVGSFDEARAIPEFQLIFQWSLRSRRAKPRSVSPGRISSCERAIEKKAQINENRCHLRRD